MSNFETFNKRTIEELKKPAEIKKGEQKPWISNTQIFITGLTKGNQNSTDQRSFSGWGMFMAEEKPDGNIFEFNQFGNLFNSDPIESALKGAIVSLKRIQNQHNIDLVFDNSYIPIVLSNKEALSLEKNTMLSLTEDSPELWRYRRRAKMVDDLLDVIKSNNRIVDLSVRYSDPMERNNLLSKNNIFSDKSGFEYSAKSAEEGFKKASRAAIWFLVNKQDNYNIGKSIVTCRKNLNNSFDATKEMMLFISEKGDDFLPRRIRTKIIRRELEPIIDTLKEIEKKSEKIKFIDSNRDKISHIISLGESYTEGNESKIERESALFDID